MAPSSTKTPSSPKVPSSPKTPSSTKVPSSTKIDVFDRLARDADPGDPGRGETREAADTETPDAGCGETRNSGAGAGERDEPSGTAEDTDAVGGPDRPGAGPHPPWRRHAAAVLVGVVVAGTLAAFGYVGWRLYEVNAAAAAGQSALAAAKDYAITLTTLDANHIDANYTQALDGATGDFKDAYALGAVQLRQMLIDNQASGKGVVVDAAVKSATKTRVQVLLFVDQSITNAVRTEPRVDRNRIQMTMERVDNRWLASQVELA